MIKARLLLGTVLTLVIGFQAACAADGSIHPYPLLPVKPVPGRTGFDSPEIKAIVAKYEAAVKSGDDKSAAAVLNSVASESLHWGHPEFLNYPGSVEHVRHHNQRYVPPYPQYNHKTLVKNFILAQHAAVRADCVDFSEPVYWHTQWGSRVATSVKAKAVKVYPWRPGKSIDLSIGKLKPRTAYALRVIGAMQTQDVVNPRIIGRKAASGPAKQFIFRLEINDRPDGSKSRYALRGRATDNFYETVLFVFQGLDDRGYDARLTLLPDSEATLYTHNVDVHDVFGECAKRAGKKRSTLGKVGPKPAKIADAAARAQRDRDLWESLPPGNRAYDDRGGRGVSGGWSHVRGAWNKPFHLVHPGGKGSCSRADLAAGKPLPGTKDTGYGVRTADGKSIHSMIGGGFTSEVQHGVDGTPLRGFGS